MQYYAILSMLRFLYASVFHPISIFPCAPYPNRLEGRARNHLLGPIYALQQHLHERLPVQRFHHIAIRVSTIGSVTDVFFEILPLVSVLLGKEGCPRFAVSLAF